MIDTKHLSFTPRTILWIIYLVNTQGCKAVSMTLNSMKWWSGNLHLYHHYKFTEVAILTDFISFSCFLKSVLICWQYLPLSAEWQFTWPPNNETHSLHHHLISTSLNMLLIVGILSVKLCTIQRVINGIFSVGCEKKIHLIMKTINVRFKYWQFNVNNFTERKEPEHCLDTCFLC